MGGLAIQLATVDATPNGIHVVLTERGASIDQLRAPQDPRTMELTGPAGQSLVTLSSGASVTTPKQQLSPETAKNVKLDSAWLRGPAGTYHLTIRYNGDERTVDLILP